MAGLLVGLVAGQIGFESVSGNVVEREVVASRDPSEVMLS
jgi:hypothetical protein